MTNVAQVRNLIKTIHEIAIYLTPEEMAAIGQVLLKVIERMERGANEV